MFDTSFFITIGLVFIASLVAAYLRAYRRDRVLKSYDGFHVTLERTDDKLIWGVMHLEPTGMEFQYSKGVEDEEHLETSYVLYGGEYATIQAIYRYADNLDEEGKARRAKDVERTFHPRPSRRLMRSARNFVIMASGSINEVMGLFLGRAQKSGGRYITAESTSALQDLSGTVIGSVGSAFDPLLEQVIGQRVVYELAEGKEVHEHVGVFKDYSPDFLMFLDVQYPQKEMMPVRLGEPVESEKLSIRHAAKVLRVTNYDHWPILIQTLSTDAGEQTINAVVDLGETIELPLHKEEVEEAVLKMQTVRELDMIVPRTRCAIRHRAETFANESLSSVVMDIVFDVGKAVQRDEEEREKAAAMEASLRQKLAADPIDAVSAAALGSMLLQQQKYSQAEKYLRAAAKYDHLLPDGGKRVRQQLREVSRRLGATPQHAWTSPPKAVATQPTEPSPVSTAPVAVESGAPATGAVLAAGDAGPSPERATPSAEAAAAEPVVADGAPETDAGAGGEPSTVAPGDSAAGEEVVAADTMGASAGQP